MSEQALTLASHAADPRAYWKGRHYELNLTFSSLRDDQWTRVLELVWGYDALVGPLTGRYYPGIDVATTCVEIPPPTAAIAQHGVVWIDKTTVVGCNVLATRSLFECVSVQVPEGMFADRTAETHPRLPPLEAIYRDLALALYGHVPFQLATVGWDRDCVLESELRFNSALCDALVEAGGFYAREDVLRGLGIYYANYEPVAPGLRWAPPAL